MAKDEERIIRELEEQRKKIVSDVSSLVLERFRVSRGDKNVISNIVNTIWLGVKSRVKKEDIKVALYRQELGYYLEKYPGIFDHTYQLLTGLPESTGSEPLAKREKSLSPMDEFIPSTKDIAMRRSKEIMERKPEPRERGPKPAPKEPERQDFAEDWGDWYHTADPNEPQFAEERPAQPQPEPRPESQRRRHRISIESYPGQGVHVRIFAIGGEPSPNQVQSLENYIKNTVTTPTAVISVVKQFINIGFSDEDQAKDWLSIELQNAGVRRPGNLVNAIIKTYLKTREISQGRNWTPFYGELQEGKYAIQFEKEYKFEGVSDPRKREHQSPDYGKYTLTNIEVQPPDNRVVHPGEVEEGQFPKHIETNKFTHPNYNTIILPLDHNVRIIAYYKSEGVIHTDRPNYRSPYQQGAYGRGRDSAVSALGQKFFKGKIDRKVEPVKIREDPHLNAAINKGMRIMNKYAKAEYTRVFIPLRNRYRTRMAELRRMQREAKQARGRLRKLLQQNSSVLGAIKHFGSSEQDLVNAATQLIQGGSHIADQVFIDARNALEGFTRARDQYFEDFNRDLETASVQLQNYLVQKAESVATQVLRRYRVPLNSDDDKKVRDALRGYAADIAEQFVTRGRTAGFAMQRGIMNMSRSLQTFGAFGNNFLYNTWILFTGPWVLMTIFVLLQFFFVLSFVGYNVQLLWVMPLITAIFTFILNFSDSMQPLDWVTHLSSGAAIGYSAMLFMVALNAQSFSFVGSVGGLGFWIVWIILCFLGIFQFYQSGGYKTVLQGSILILLFAYLALGPYQAYYNQVIDQAKAPVEIAYRAGERAVTDVWLLATNPTEWYARQQVQNVRPERPLSFPKGIEIAAIEALPPSVPAGQQFALAVVIKHDGIIENATDVTLSLSCNQWCDSSFAVVSPDLSDDLKSPCVRCTTGNEDNVWCSPSSSAKDGRCELTYENCIAKIPGDFASYGTPYQCPAITEPTRVDTSRLPKHVKDALAAKTAFYIDDVIKRGEATIINSRNFVSRFIEGRQAEANFARVYFNLSYGYSTSSSLLVSVISNAELNRRFTEGETVFKQVTAVSKTTPAQVSINVGPQPLQEGADALLLIGVANTRDESKVVLEANSSIIVRIPRTVAENPRCDQFVPVPAGDALYNESYHTIVYKVPQHVEVLAYEFQSIFAFICNFRTVNSIDTLRTGLVTVEMPYTFRLEQKKDIPITPPLGIIYEPFESTCAACGTVDITSIGTAIESAADICTPGECFDITSKQGKPGNPSSTCYYEYAGRTITQFAGTACHVCGSRNNTCDKFLSEETCTEASGKCGWSCTWLPGEYIHPISNVPLEGRCAKVSAGPTQALAGGACDRIRQAAASFKSSLPNVDEQVRSEGIANSFEEMVLKLAWHENEFRHCKPDPTKDPLYCINDNTYQSLVCSADPSQRIASCGAMQIAININKQWRDSTQDYGCNGKGAYDLDCNVKIGIGLLIDNYKTFGTSGNPNPSCRDSRYRSKYQGYRGWKAALRAYNGWGCPADYLGGIEAAGNFVENVIATDVSKVSAECQLQAQQQSGQQSGQQAETCSTCTGKNQVWCTTTPASQSNGACLHLGPCPSPLVLVASSSQCPASSTSQPQQTVSCGDGRCAPGEETACAQDCQQGDSACTSVIGGTCQTVSAQCRGAYTQGYCGGSADRQCCDAGYGDKSTQAACLNNGLRWCQSGQQGYCATLNSNCVQGYAAIESCGSCTIKGSVWCTTSTPSQSSGACIPTGPCEQQFPNQLTAGQCPA